MFFRSKNRNIKGKNIVTKTSSEALFAFNEYESNREKGKYCPECGAKENGFGCGVDSYGYHYHKCTNPKCRCEWKEKY